MWFWWDIIRNQHLGRSYSGPNKAATQPFHIASYCLFYTLLYCLSAIRNICMTHVLWLTSCTPWGICSVFLSKFHDHLWLPDIRWALHLSLSIANTSNKNINPACIELLRWWYFPTTTPKWDDSLLANCFAQYVSNLHSNWHNPDPKPMMRPSSIICWGPDNQSGRDLLPFFSPCDKFSYFSPPSTHWE